MDAVLRQSPRPLTGGNRLDVIRVLLTVGIVCRHATSENLRPVVLLTEVCVPLFFALSGYLFFHNAPGRPEFRWFGKKIRSRFFSLLIPYLIANVIAWGCYYFALKEVPTLVSGYLADRWKDPLFVFWTGPVNLSLWFIRELIIAVLLSPLLYLLIRYTRWWGVLALGLWWALLRFGLLPPLPLLKPEPLFLFSAGGCLGYWQIAPAERWLHAPARISPRSRAWSFFVYLYHYLLLIGVKKALALLWPPENLLAEVAVWLCSILIVLALLSGLYVLLRRFAPRLCGILIGGK